MKTAILLDKDAKIRPTAPIHPPIKQTVLLPYRRFKLPTIGPEMKRAFCFVGEHVLDI
jgi:hypothetical protein